MKLFCSNAFTGENFEKVSKRMKLVVDALDKAGHEAYCPMFDQHKIELQKVNNTKAIFNYAFQNINKNEGMVAIVSSSRKSEGQLMEIGATLSQNKPIYLFIHESAKDSPSHLSKLATRTFVWSDENDLMKQLADI